MLPSPAPDDDDAEAYAAAVAAARTVMDAKAKPVGSLGELEQWGCRLAALQRSLTPRIERAALLLFAADHGVTASVPAITAYPREVIGRVVPWL